ncbi:hypothetical protein ONZ43_g6980 [Nemania bipapillata]|uniref:Uncharacterized protein n=1 Tax=Nemania bipapillata TaxID=110536 RepID=A0ACC2HVX8_9PEZI|nr:hypothetical protein ONZ43_g6980 [Nemania bipapillata]
MEVEPSKTDLRSREAEMKEMDSSSLPSTAVEEKEQQEPGVMTTSPSPSPSPDGPQEGDPLHDYLTGPKLALLLLSTGLIFFVLLLDNSIISTAVPKITSEFHSLPDVGCSVLQPLTGKFYTYFPTKWTFLVFFFIFEIGSLLCAVATSSPFFIVGRAVAGLGVSGLQNGSLTIVAGAVPLQKRACFYINLPLGALAGAMLAAIKCPEQIVKAPFSLALVRRVIPQLDIIGFILFAPAATLLLLALQFGSGGTYAWNSSLIIGLFVGSGVAAILFLLWEWKAGDVAIIPFSMVKNRIVWASTLQYITLISAVFVGTQYFPIYFQAVKGAVVAIQHALPMKQSQLGLSFLVFCQTFSAAVFVVVGNTIFTQSLISETLRLVPSISPTDVLRAGGSADAIRSLVPPKSPELAALLRAFSNSFDTVCYLMITLAGLSIFAALGMGWVDTRKTESEHKVDTPAEA